MEHRIASRDRYRKLITEAKTAAELCADLDVEQLVFDLVASEAVANVAALLDDTPEFERARSTSLNRIRDAITAGVPQRGRRKRSRV
jgi:hypothetical protein